MYVNIGHSEDVIAAWQDDARPEDSATFAGDAPQSNARSADAAALETSGISFAAGPAVPAGEFARLLEGALDEIARLRREDPEALAERIAHTSRDLLGR